MCIIIGMSWASVSSTLLPPVGVVIGASGTLLGQHLALRVDARCEAAQRAADQRAERKDAIICFLSTTEWVEQRRDERPGKPDRGNSALVELMHAGWLAKKIIELVCSGELAQAALDYPLELNRASKELRSGSTGQRPTGLSAREWRLRAEFMEAARHETGYAGEPLLRRMHAEADQPEGGTPAIVQT
ncbi:MAG TPA: hypothetical protein VN969_46700 [Streptosporangiaceae bacterium]|jgi:hypothetical protein|nr:hypothetical protein [Streptosporangiaceae bacterium]